MTKEQAPEVLRLSDDQIAEVMELVDDFGLKCDEYGHSITKLELMGARRAVREKLRSLRVAPGRQHEPPSPPAPRQASALPRPI